MELARPVVREYGESAVWVTIDSPDVATRRRRAVDLRELLQGRRPPGVTDLVAGLESLLVEFDPLLTDPAMVSQAIEMLGSIVTTGTGEPHRVLDLPVVFDDRTGPDLKAVAAEQGLTPDQLVDSLTSHDLTIVLLAAAMAPMMTGVQLPSPVARQASPRTDVAPGSVMIAGDNAIIQPFPGPTGWRVVGRTPMTIVDINDREAIGFRPGDVVRLRPITTQQADGLRDVHWGMQ